MPSLQQLFQLHKITFGLFLSIGALAACVYFIAFSILWKIAGVNYQVAVTISYILSVITHFTGNKTFTFKSYDQKFYKLLSKYFFLILLNYVLMLEIVYFTVTYFKLSPYIGSIISIGVTTIISYLLSKYWIFKATHKK